MVGTVSDSQQPPTGPSTVLTVCTGNICRSPYAERVLAMYFAVSEVQFSSAGLASVVGADIDDNVKALMPGRTLRTRHHATQITPDHVLNSDIVFTMTKEQRADVVRLVPRAVRKVFTLREAARLIMVSPHMADPANPRDAFVRLASHLTPVRGQQAGMQSDDVADPYRRGAAAYETMKDEMDPALAVIVRYALGQLERPTMQQASGPPTP